MRNCSACEKPIWGLKGGGFKCGVCSQFFHPACKDSIEGQRKCVQRKKLDFSLKKLTYLQEVAVVPFVNSLHVAASSSSQVSGAMVSFDSSTSVRVLGNQVLPLGSEQVASLSRGVVA